MPTAAYGSWPSPIDPADLVVGSAGLDHTYGLVVGDAVYWTQSDAADGGRVVLWRADAATGERRQVTPGRYVRSAINEYGGGAWSAALVDAREVAVYSDWPSGDVRVASGGDDRLLAPGGPLRYGSLSIDAARRVVVAVREDHCGGGEPVNTVVALSLDGDNADGGRVLAQGADFYATPVSAGGWVAWVEWDHPNMPWDHTSLMAAPLDGSARPVRVDGGASVMWPSWTPDGRLVYLSDASGHWNFRLWDGDRHVALHDHPFDFCGPMWAPDPAPYSILDGDTLRIGCSWLDDGFARLGVLDAATGELRRVDSPAVEATVSGHGTRAAVLLGYADKPCELAVLDWDTGHAIPVASNAAGQGPDLGDCTSLAQPFTFDGDDGPVHAWYYPPSNDGYTAPDGELPPVQVWSHGGPTGFNGPAFRLSTQFWTSRGIGILDVNYSGSTGYGRAYRERLKGRWGLADVSDCAKAALALADHGLADRRRLSIRGSSAGGYTTLAALVFTDVFAAGISLYGIGDLETLATDTHKFESRYLDGLVAPFPQGRQVYLDRSPRHHLDRLSCPMLILQGADDKVVPPQQAYAMEAAVRAKGLPVRLIVFDGEGHGFRKAESIMATARASLEFLAEVHGFRPNGSVVR